METHQNGQHGEHVPDVTTGGRAASLVCGKLSLNVAVFKFLVKLRIILMINFVNVIRGRREWW